MHFYANNSKIQSIMNDENKKKKCVLYDRDCIDCMECKFCDLDPQKLCDNCGKCLNVKDFASISVTFEGDEDKSTRR